jgi:hypothetical protein
MIRKSQSRNHSPDGLSISVQEHSSENRLDRRRDHPIRHGVGAPGCNNTRIDAEPATHASKVVIPELLVPDYTPMVFCEALSCSLFSSLPFQCFGWMGDGTGIHTLSVARAIPHFAQHGVEDGIAEHSQQRIEL